MSRDDQRLREQLELATSRQSLDISTLDESTVELREGWLALERLLRESDGAPAGPSSEQVAITLPFLRQTRQVPWRAVGGGIVALAGALLLALLLLPERTHTVGDSTNQDVASSGSTGLDSSSSAGDEVASSSAWQKWDDEWEQRVDATSVALQELRTRSASQDSILSRLEDRFSELADEFHSNSL